MCSDSAKTMDLKGYQEFKMMLSLSLRESEEEPGMEGDISLDDSFTEVAKKALNTNMNALTETYSLLDENSFFQAIDATSPGEENLFFRCGSSLLTALKADE